MIRRRAPLRVVVALALASAACNALIGGHDRSLEGDDDVVAPPTVDAGADGKPEDGAAPTDARVDTGVDAGMQWTSPNGAHFTVDGTGGVTITDYLTSAQDHPIVVPAVQATTPSGDYTVTARVRVPIMEAGAPVPEFGILARVGAAGAAVLCGSAYGGGANVFVGTIASPDYNPPPYAFSATYTFLSGYDYMMKMQISGETVSCKLWNATGAEPGFMVTADITDAGAAFATGRGVGYYNYKTPMTTLISLTAP